MWPAHRRGTRPARPRGHAYVTALSTFGVISVCAGLLFYALEERHPAFVLAFALACISASVYGFLQGAWPFGFVELAWAGVAMRRWWVRRGRAGASSSPDRDRTPGSR